MRVIKGRESNIKGLAYTIIQLQARPPFFVTKESTDNKVDFTITAERGDKTTAAEMVNKKDLSTDENYKLNSKNKTNGSNYTELTSSGHVSGFSGDVSTETKIGDIAWKVKVTH